MHKLAHLKFFIDNTDQHFLSRYCAIATAYSRFSPPYRRVTRKTSSIAISRCDKRIREVDREGEKEMERVRLGRVRKEIKRREAGLSLGRGQHIFS